MRRGPAGPPARLLRLLAAALLTPLLAVSLSSVSAADPSSQERLADAQAQLAALNEDLSLLVEQYDAAVIALETTEQRLSDARAAAKAARAEADVARAFLSERARAAYMGSTGGSLAILLGAESYSEFADRLEYVSRAAQQDAEAIAAAEAAGAKAARSAKELSQAAKDRRDLIGQLDAKTKEIEAGIAQQEDLVAQIQADIAAEEAARKAAEEAARRAAEEAARRAAEEAAQQQQQQDQQPPGGGQEEPPPSPEPEPQPPPDPEPTEPPPPPPPPPPVGQGADAAIAAAKSVIGVPYKWGGDSPEEGFDCSGLTMWSWAFGGVNLPHSSSAQYAVLPHISTDDLQPGDLLFFYSPIHHVSMYLGGNTMIHADHPGSTVHIETISEYYWDVYVGAGRPG